MEGNSININLTQEGDGAKKETTYTKLGKLVFSSIANAKWKVILKVYIVFLLFIATSICSLFLYNASQDKDIVKGAAESLAFAKKVENLRDFVVTPKIQNELNTLVYVLNADRAFLFELHNGKKNSSGLPFRFADMTYEETNEDRNIDKVATRFQNIPLTLYKYPHYLQEKKFLIGTVDDIAKVDRDFANYVKECNGEYLAMIYLNDSGNPLGFLCVSFHSKEGIPSRDFIMHKMNEYAKSVTQLLDFDIQINRNKEMFENK